MIKNRLIILCTVSTMMVSCSSITYRETLQPTTIKINHQTDSIESKKAPKTIPRPGFNALPVNQYQLDNGLTVLHFQSELKVTPITVMGLFLDNPEPYKPINLSLNAAWNQVVFNDKTTRISLLAANVGVKVRSLAGSIATGWYFETLLRNQSHGLKLLSTIVQKRAYSESELSYQKQNYSLNQQLKSVNGLSQSSQLYKALVFSKNSAIARQSRKSSRDKSLSTIGISELENYFNQSFIAPSMVLIIISPTQFEQLKPEIELQFSELGKNKPVITNQKIDSNNILPSFTLLRPEDGLYAISRPNSTQVDIRISFTPISIEKHEYQSLKIFADTLAGRSLNSRMQSDLRERQGLSYSIYHQLDQVSNFHSLHFLSSTEDHKLPALLSGMQQHIDYLLNNGLSNKEFEFIKQRRLVNLQRSRIHPFQKISFMLQNFTNDNPLDKISHEANELSQLSYLQFQKFVKRIKNQQQIVILTGDTAAIKHHLCQLHNCDINWYSSKLLPR